VVIEYSFYFENILVSWEKSIEVFSCVELLSVIKEKLILFLINELELLTYNYI